MPLNWTPVSNFDDILYATLLKLEAPLAIPRLMGLLVNGNFTIGIGFDLVAGSRPVQNGVFRQLGLNATVVDMSTRPASGELAQREYDFIQSLRTAANQHLGAEALSAIMTQRAAVAGADPAYAAYIGTAARSTFSFSNESEVRSAFDDLWPNVYRRSIFNTWPELNNYTGLSSSKELIVLASLVWNGGPGFLRNSVSLRSALNSGERAEAWYEIRYGSNGGTSPSEGLAKRRYVESELFGLYDDPANVSADEAKRIFSMMTRHHGNIFTYEARYGVPADGTSAERNMIALANNDATLTSIAVVSNLGSSSF